MDFKFGGPREAPQSPSWAFPGPPGASRGPPGPKTNQSKKLRNLKELTEQWRQAVRTHKRRKTDVVRPDKPRAQALPEWCPKLTPNPLNLEGLVASMAPNPMNLYGLVASMAPNPTSAVC